MEEQIRSVHAFHNTFGQPDPASPQLVDEDTYHLRFKLMQEENLEYFQACEDNNLVEIADALGDQLYVLCGTILKHGLQHKIEEVFNEIHRSNMSKLGADGKPMIRPDGKILKGPGYFRPDIGKILQ